MAGGLLHVAKGHPGVEGGGDERVPEAVRADPFGDARSARQALDHAVRGVAVHAGALGAQEGRSRRALTDAEVDRPRGARRQWDRDVPPLRRIFIVRCPRSKSRSSMSALRASEIRSPLSASNDARAWSRGEPRPAWTKNAPSSLR